MKLHLFYPENDLALANGKARYTAPAAATRLRHAGATLPLWYGNSGDAVVSAGINAEWLRQMCEHFDIGVEPWRHRPAGYQAAPWGWSAAARQTFIDMGFDRSQLPDDAFINNVRALSHRRTAAEVSRIVKPLLPFATAPAAEELCDISAVERFVAAHPGGTVLKLPWSSSGRGLVPTDPTIFASQRANIEGMLGRQGTVMAEVRMKPRLDFALLFTMDGGRCHFDGYSVFQTEGMGAYSGNTLAPQAELERTINEAAGFDATTPLIPALTTALEAVAACYTGPLGVDMMVVEDTDGYAIAPVVEINFRMTMGHLCRIIYDKHICAGARGTFAIKPASSAAPSGFFEATTHNGRMTGGRLDLAQPGSDFAFEVSLYDK